MSRITLVIAHPDRAFRHRLASEIAPSSFVEVMAETTDLMTTYTVVEEREPMAVLIAERLALMPEFEVMRALFSALDVRWLVIKTRSETEAAREASPWNRKSDLFAIDPDTPAQILVDMLRSVTRTARRNAQTIRSQPVAPRSPAGVPRSDRFILLGASTGGVDALLTVLSHFPSDCPPTFIVQHTGGGFGDSLTRLLDRQCAATVRAARDGDTVRPGEVVIAAGSRAHLMLGGGHPMRIVLRSGEPVSGHMPSVDVLFSSAVPGAGRAVAALLTGMGRDGAQGLKELRDAGATTFAQDEATSIVYGMPRAAVQLGAAQSCLPLAEIGPAVLRACEAPKSSPSARIIAK